MPEAIQLFEALVREHADALTLYLKSVLGNSADVDDLFQETMVVAWRRLDEFDQTRPFGAWLRGIARNLVAAHRRTSARKRCSPAVMEQIEARLDQISARRGDTWHEKLAFLQDCIDALPEHHRRVVRLRYFQEQAIQQMSQSLELSADAVKKRLQCARALVMQCINRKLPTLEQER